MRNQQNIRRTVLLWSAVTVLLWLTVPLLGYGSHWTWFAWMPFPQGSAAGERQHPHLWLNWATLLLMSSVVLAIVLWLSNVREDRRQRGR